jgi:hypothetical protein
MNQCAGNAVAHQAYGTLKNLHVVYFPSTEAYKNFEGFRLAPKPEHLVHSGSAAFNDPFRRVLDDTEHSKNPALEMVECINEMSNGASWHVQRLGPFISHGNYSWHQFGWQDVFHLSSTLQRHTEGVYITDRFLKAVDGRGHALHNPPIHVHHLHITPGIEFGRFDWPYEMCALEKKCYFMPYFLEQHGEYECERAEGSDNCVFAPYPEGYGVFVNRPLDFEGEINDARAPDSIPLTWWLQVSIKVKPKKNFMMKALSNSLITNIGFFDEKQQDTYEHYFWVPTDRATVFWYTGRMPNSGRLIRNRLHIHQYVHDESFFFFASKEDLSLSEKWEVGLSDRGLTRPIDLSELGYGTFMEVKSFLLSRITNLNTNLNVDGMDDLQPPALVCSACRGLEQVDGFEYDRRGRVKCHRWSFRKGDAYTVIAFLNATRQPMGPHQPNFIPPKVPMHLQHNWVYEASDGKSHYSLDYSDFPFSSAVTM